MSIQPRDHSILKAVEEWKERCLLNSRGVFTDSRTWNYATFEKLYEDFVEHPDASTDKSFFVKLKHQLAKSQKDTIRLAAEMLWFMSLASSNVLPQRKRLNITQVWKWTGDGFDENHKFLQDDVLHGYANTGVSFNTNRWRELSYFITVMMAFFKLQPAKRKELLSTSKNLALWLEDIEDTPNRQFRHILLFLLFPKKIERITSNNQRKLIVKAFEKMSSKEFNKLACWEIDEILLSIRKREAKRLGREDIEFYLSPLREVWEKPSNDISDAQDESEQQKIEEEEETRRKEIEAQNPKNKKQLIDARRGHGKYRANLSLVENQCRVTGTSEKKFLTASHIRPWRHCDDKACLDGNNGLWLAPHIDRLFDRGWITFDYSSGDLLCANTNVERALEQWGIEPSTSIGTLNKEQARYMKYHNEELFKGNSKKK
ncbi:HNH endonuclease [Shewanella seohaensis]|uniref:HNH endonuclease n=1 Tax=Shewanella seohaensis TaxID=755175 RepID=UPI0035B91B31